MNRRDQGFFDLLRKAAQLMAQALEKSTAEECFLGEIMEICREMDERYGEAIGAIEINIGFLMVKTERTGRRPHPSFACKFGESREDKAMAQELGLSRSDLEEMNRTLEQARRERTKGASVNGETAPGPPEERPAFAADPRSTGEIANSIRAIARELSPSGRRAFCRYWEQHLRKIGGFEEAKINLPKERDLENNTIWLRTIQEIINFIQRERKAPELRKMALLALEKVVERAKE